MTPPARSLLDFRVVIVTGKGGTGKTTVAASLAEAARQAGQRVLLAETASTESAARVFEGPRAKPVGHTGRAVRPGLDILCIDPFESLSEYLRLQMRIGGLADRVIGTQTFQQFLEAVPGWRELILLGKIWHLEQKTDAQGAHQYDLIIIDAPATGHGLTFLDVPRVVQQAVRAGPLTRHAGWVEELIHDRERTLLLPVTLPEELPVSETIELVERARDEIDIGIDRIVVNALPPALSPELQSALGDWPKDSIEFETLPPSPTLHAILEHTDRRGQLARVERERAFERCQLPLVDLPECAPNRPTGDAAKASPRSTQKTPASTKKSPGSEDSPPQALVEAILEEPLSPRRKKRAS